MFKLNENYQVDRTIPKCDYNRYSPAEISTMKTLKSQIYINILREDSVTSLLNSYLDLNFEVIEKADKSRYRNGNDVRLVNLGLIVLFSNFKLSTSSVRHLEDISHAHIVFLMYNLITSAKGSHDLSIAFDRDCGRRRDKLVHNKNTKGKYHLRIMLKDELGFVEHEEKATYGLGYNLTLTKNKDEAVIDKAGGVADPRRKIDHIQRYVPHYTPFVQQQGFFSEQFLSKTPRELRYVERSIFMKEMNIQNLWNFKLGSH